MTYQADFPRAFLVILNIGFWFLGGAALGAGFYIKVDKQQMMDVLSRIPYQGENLKMAVVKTSLLDKSALVLIVLGAFILIIGACGMYGAIKSSRKLLYIYIAVVTAVMLLEIAAIGTSAYFKTMVKDRLKTYLQHTLTKKYIGAGITPEGHLHPDTDPLSAAWDFAMGYLECCGNTNYTDFMTVAEHWNSTYSFKPAGTNTTFVVNATVPPMCCKMVDQSKFPGDITDIEFIDIRGCLEHPRQVNANLEPCYDKLYAVFLQYIKLALIIVTSVILLEVVVVVAAIALIRDITRMKSVPRHMDPI